MSLQEATPGWVCTWQTHPAGMDQHRWQARSLVTYLSWALPTASVTWGQWCDRVLSWAIDGGCVAACQDLPREPVAVQPWTLSLHLPTVAPRLAAVDPKVWPLEGEPGFKLGPDMEVWSVRLLRPMTQGLLWGFCFTRSDGPEVSTAVHRQLSPSWDAPLWPPGYDELVGGRLEAMRGEKPMSGR